MRVFAAKRSLVPRRCRPLKILQRSGVAAAAALALLPAGAVAQMLVSDTSTTLLQPSLDGNPVNQPRFRRPGDGLTASANQPPPTNAFALPATPPRIGAPVYGSPPAFGAGDTGFDSRNLSKRRRLVRPASGATAATAAPTETFAPVPLPVPPAPSPLPVRVPTLPPEVYPAKAAARPGAVLPQPLAPLPISNPPPEVHPAAAAYRPGAALPVPPPVEVESPASTPPPGTPTLNTLPIGTPALRPTPAVAGDPYEAIGIKAGSFLILPALELDAGYDNNPQHVPGGPGSSYFIAAPELHVRSDWPANALTADIVGTYSAYATNFTPSLSRPYLNAKVDGRLDAGRDTQILLENRLIVSTDNPGSPNISAGLAKLPIDTTVGGTLGVVQDFNRIVVTVKGTADRSMYEDSQLTDGETVSNKYRDFDQFAGILRVGYGSGFVIKPFVEVSADTRNYDLQFDINGQQRDSTGASGKLGVTFDPLSAITGEIAVGYLKRVYQDPFLPDIGGMTLDGTVTWLATALTTLKFNAASTVSESILQNVAGSFSHDYNLEIDHAFRRWLVFTGKLGYGTDDYVGLDRFDRRYFISAGLTYKFNRMLQVRSELRHDWLTSDASNVAYEATAVLFGVRLQR